MVITTLEKLQAAIARGDLAAAAELTGTLAAEALSAKKPARKPRTSEPSEPLLEKLEKLEKRERRERASGAKKAEVPAPAPAPGRELLTTEREGWIAPSRGVRVAGDGTARREARRQSMAGEGRFNTWKDNGRVEKALAGVDDQLAAQSLTPRRPPVERVRINCDGCGRDFQVWPSELYVAHDDQNRPYHFHKCERCIARGK